MKEERKLKTLICTCCKKEFPREIMSIECPKCYLDGIKREREKEQKQK